MRICIAENGENKQKGKRRPRMQSKWGKTLQLVVLGERPRTKFVDSRHSHFKGKVFPENLTALAADYTLITIIQ